MSCQLYAAPHMRIFPLLVASAAMHKFHPCPMSELEIGFHWLIVLLHSQYLLRIRQGY